MSVVETAAVIAATVFCCHMFRKISDARSASVQGRPEEILSSRDTGDADDVVDEPKAARALVKMRAASSGMQDRVSEVPWSDMDVVREESRIDDDTVHDGISLDLLSSAFSGRVSDADCLRISSQMKGRGLEHEAAAVMAAADGREKAGLDAPTRGVEDNGLPGCFVRR